MQVGQAAPLQLAAPLSEPLDAETQLPALHVPPVTVQSLHRAPPAPHVVSPGVRHVPLESQHPAQEVLPHVVPLLLPLLLLPPLPLPVPLLVALPELLALLE